MAECLARLSVSFQCANTGKRQGGPSPVLMPVLARDGVCLSVGGGEVGPPSALPKSILSSVKMVVN